MRLLLLTLALTLPLCLPAQSTGDVLLGTKSASGGQTPVWVTKTASRALGWDSSGNLTAIPTGSGGGTWGSITGTLSAQTDLQSALDAKASTASLASYLTSATAATTYQPLDADLTAIAALTTTSFGRGLLTETDAASTRGTLGLGTLATQSATITDYLTTATAASTYASLSGSYSNPAWITSLAWSKVSSTPTTLSGYGITDALTAATAASTYEPLITAGTTGQYYRGDKSWQTLNATAVGLGNVSNALQLVAANNLSDLANAATARTNLGLGTLATQNGTFTTGGNGDADAGKIPLLTAHGGLILGNNDVADGNIITVRTGYGYGIAVAVAGNGQGIYSELNDSFSQAFHAHVTHTSTGAQTGYDADLTGGSGVNYGLAVLCNDSHFPFYVRERDAGTGVGHDRYTIDAQGEHTWYANGTTLTTGSNKTSLLIETPSGTAAYTLKAGRTGDLVSTGDTGTVTPTMLSGSIPASKLTGTDIATVGTITSGTWQGSIIAPAYLGTGSSISTKYLRGDGTWQTIAGGGDALTTSPLSQFAATTSAQFAGVISDETGTGAVVLASSPTLTTPNLGTPSALTLTNATGLPLSTGVTGTLPIANGGTGATTASAARIALLPSMTGNGGKFLRVNAGATDYELATISGGGDALTTSPLSQFAATTSSQFAGVISDETGTGAVVLASSPTLTTPNLGTPSAATLTNATGLPLSTGVTGTLPIANGGTGQTGQTSAFDALAPTTTKGDLIVSNGTDNIRVPVGATNGHVLTVDSAEASGVKWAAASGGGSGGNWVLISTTTISGSPTNLDFTFSGSYRRYRLELENVYGSADGYMIRIRTSTDGGSTFDSGTANYGYAYGAHGTYGPVSTTGTYMETTTNLIGSASDEGLWGTIDFYDPLNTATKTFCQWIVFGRIYNSAAANVVTGAGYRDSAADVDAVRLLLSSGTFAGGKVRLFGWSE